MDLPRLVDLAAERLGFTVEYDPAALTGSMTLRIDKSLTDQELWELTNRVLAGRGLTTVRIAGRDALSVVKISEASSLARLEFEELNGAHLPAAAGDRTAGPAPDAPGPTDGRTGGPGAAAASEPSRDKERDALTGGPSPSAFAPGFANLLIRARHRPAKELIDAIRPILSKPGGSAVPIGDSGLILIADLSVRIEEALALLERLDAPGERAVLESIPLRHSRAAELVELATQVQAKQELVAGRKLPGELLPGPDGASVLLITPASRLEDWRALIERLDEREPVLTVTYTPRALGAAEVGALIDEAVRGPDDDGRWRLVVDDLTGTLIITASPAQHERIVQLLERLESVPEAARRPVRTYVVRNRNAHEVAEIIHGLLSAGILAGQADEAEFDASRASEVRAYAPPSGAPPTPRAGSQTAAGAPADTTMPGATQAPPSEPTVERQPAASLLPPLLVTVDQGTSTLIATGDPRLLSQLDALIDKLDVRQPQVMLEVLLVSLTDSQTLDLGVELEALDLSGDTLWRLSSLFGLSGRAGDTRAVGDAAGLTGVVLNPGDFAIVLRALETINNGRSLSMPRVLASNNQPATIDSVLQVPFTVINASNTVATTSFGGTLDAGTVVTIRPQIAQGDHLLLEYSVRLSSFVGASASPSLPPPRQQNQVQSVVSIPDGHTVVVGGLELITDDEAVSQVPLLGRLPLLGELFKNRSFNTSRTRFFVFIRAGVLRDGQFEDLKHLSAQAIREAQVDDGWPVLEPRIIR